MAQGACRSKKDEAELKKIHRDAIEDAKHEPFPTIVLAYQNVYGQFLRLAAMGVSRALGGVKSI